MSKFNTKTEFTPRVINKLSPLQGVSPLPGSTPATTHEGADAVVLDEKSELFSLAVTNMVEDKFYEDARSGSNRFTDLIHKVTKVDPEWVANLLNYLRNGAYLRSASIMGAAEYVRAGGPNGRSVVRSVLARADEPGEMLAYWTTKYGRSIPQPIKRGVADAAKVLYDEYTVQKYDSDSRNFRFADVIQLVHPKPSDAEQVALFKYALDSRYQGSDAVPGEILEMLHNSKTLDKRLRENFTVPTVEELRAAGWTWEKLSSYGSFTSETWEAIIPSMGYMALLRNLRNFENHGVSDKVMDMVRDRLSDPERVARSKQLPFRFYSAYREVTNVKTQASIEEAFSHSFKNVNLPGKTLVLIDVSGSMSGSRGRTKIIPRDIAAVMGVAAALGCDADVAVFGTSSKRVEVRRGGSVINTVERLKGNQGVGHGTAIGSAINTQYDGHDRILVMTDMQSRDTTRVRVSSPTYLFDLSGYGKPPVFGKKSVMFAGWSDHYLNSIPLIESGRNAKWPWE